MEATERNIDAFIHARWRVNFFRHLLDLHETSPEKGTGGWFLENAEYLHRLQMSEYVLHRFPADWQSAYPVEAMHIH